MSLDVAVLFDRETCLATANRAALEKAAQQFEAVFLRQMIGAMRSASLAEGIASRGDRRIGRVIERVWRSGGVFQEWSEHFDLDRWIDAMAAEGLDPGWYTTRHRTEDEVLPWDHIAAGLHRDFLWQDWRDALAEVGLPDCRWTPCYDCGACTGYGVEHVVASAVPPAARTSSATASARSASRSAADEYRSFGRLARHLRMIASSLAAIGRPRRCDNFSP